VIVDAKFGNVELAKWALMALIQRRRIPPFPLLFLNGVLAGMSSSALKRV
jgi:hypothetical protein